MARVRTLSDLGRKQPRSGWEQWLLGAEPACGPGAKLEEPRGRGKLGGLCRYFLSRAVGGLRSVCLLQFVQSLREPFMVDCGLTFRDRPPNLSVSLWPSGAPPPECHLCPSVSVRWVGHSRPRHLPDSHGRSCGVHTKCSGFRIRTF